MLKIGDKVKVRNDLEIWNLYNDVPFISQMQKLKGKQVTISKVKTDDDFEGYYLIKEDGETVYWTDEMFEPIEENPMPKLESGMFVKNNVGVYGVVAGNKIVYKDGGYDFVSDVIEDDGYIVQIIEANFGFDSVRFGKIVWEYKEKKEEKPKTYLEDFIEKHPKFKRFEDDYPISCTGECYDFDCPKEISCKDCWNAPKGKWNK